MGTGAITQYVDVAQVVLYAFWAFFAGLVVYLVRENKREGYPLETENGTIAGFPPRPRPKTFLLASGDTVQVPNDAVSPQTLNAEPAHRFAGAPLEPVGDPLMAGVGPGAWADRSDTVELRADGTPTLSPLRTLADFTMASRDRDPRGMPVIGADGEVGGTVTDLWVDTSELIVRYLELAVPLSDGAVRQVLLPLTFARITPRGVQVKAIHGAQFAGVPGLKDPVTVTTLEEERISAYYGAGLLYADADRAEPLF